MQFLKLTQVDNKATKALCIQRWKNLKTSENAFIKCFQPQTLSRRILRRHIGHFRSVLVNYRDVMVTKTFVFARNVCLPHENETPAFSNYSGLRAFSKAPFS